MATKNTKKAKPKTVTVAEPVTEPVAEPVVELTDEEQFIVDVRAGRETDDAYEDKYNKQFPR